MRMGRWNGEGGKGKKLKANKGSMLKAESSKGRTETNLTLFTNFELSAFSFELILRSN